jgi:hypothetical protein
MMLALVLYAVTTIAAPAGMSVDLDRTAQPAPVSAPPAALALSQRGSVAMVVLKTRATTHGIAIDSQILVVRPNRTRVLLHRPPDSLLATAFRTYALGPNGEHDYSGARFAGVALAADGTPFATLEFPFSGAYSGVEDAVFIWNGRRWRAALPDLALPIDPTNFAIAAAASPSRFACNGDYLNTTSNLDAAQSDPHYQENAALAIDGARTLSLGFGAATAMSGAFIVGYSDGSRSVTFTDRPVQKPTALEWMSGRRSQLGRGIAYGVNARGDAVGNDGEAPLPMLWQNGRAIRLTDAAGTAYAIAADATIVGAVGDRAFVVTGGDPGRKLVRIDKLLRDRRWHITAAYAIASSGRILAVGRREQGPPRIVLLDPTS